MVFLTRGSWLVKEGNAVLRYDSVLVAISPSVFENL